MAFKLFKNNFVVAITSGIVAAVVAPILMPAIKRSSRPVAKGLVKGGLFLYEKGREATAHAGEMMEDVMAEIQAEQAEKQSATMSESELEREEFAARSNPERPFKPVMHEEPSSQAKHHGTAAP